MKYWGGTKKQTAEGLNLSGAGVKEGFLKDMMFKLRQKEDIGVSQTKVKQQRRKERCRHQSHPEGLLSPKQQIRGTERSSVRL